MSKAKFKIESGVQLLARLTKKPVIENFYPVLFDDGPRCGDIIELSSDCNTSHILIDLICEALILNEKNDVEVLLFNTDGNLNYNNLLENLKNKLKVRNVDNKKKLKNDSELETLLRETIANFYMLEVYDATQMYTTIFNLENILMQHSNIALVIFDTLTAFYWSEQSFKITRMDLYVKNLIQCIHKVTKEYKITCLFTKPSYFNKNKTEDNVDLNSIDLINYRMHLTNNIDDKNTYEVHVKVNKMQFIKNYNIVNNKVMWH